MTVQRTNEPFFLVCVAFRILRLVGTGKLDGSPGATIHFTFTDAGEPGGTNGTHRTGSGA